MTTSVALLEVNAANVQKAYIAYYGRPADPAGLNFWTTAGTSSTTMLTIMRDFGASAEFAALYGSGTNAAFVNAIYRNVFGRDADAGGLNFYVNALTNGSITRADVVFNVLNGATGADATIVANKVDFATQYTTALAANVTAYVNYDATFGIPQARTALSGVTATSTAAQITASVNTSVTTVAAGATPPVTTGNTYTFTTNIETFSGTAYGDTFDGRVAASNGTFQDGDIVFGGSGNDSITLTLQGGSVGGALNSVETANLRMVSSTTIDLINWSGTTNINVTNDSVDDKTLTLNNADLADVFTLSDKVNVVTSFLDTTGTGDVAKLVLNNAGTGSFSTLGVETINIGASGTNVFDVEGSASLTTLSVSGVGTLTVTTNDSVSAINLSGFSGTSTVTVSAASNIAFTGGGGNDTFTLSLQNLTSADTISGGAGNDTINVNIDNNDALKNVGGFETGNFAYSATTISTTVSGFSTINLSGGAGNTSLTLSGIAAGADLNLGGASADDVYLDFVSGAANIDITAVTAVSYDDIFVSGASTLDFSIEGASGAAITIDTIRASGVGYAAVRAGVSGTHTLTAIFARQASGLDFVASGNASLTIAGVTGYAFSNASVIAQGSAAQISVAELAASGQAATITVNGQGTATRATLSAVSGQNATLTLAFGAGADGNVTVGQTNVGASGSVASLSVNIGDSAGAVVGAVSGLSIAGVSILVGAEGSANVGDLTADGVSGTIGTISIDGARSGVAILGNINASAGVGALLVSGAASSDITIGTITGRSGIANASFTVAASGDLTVGNIAAVNGQVSGISINLAAAASAGFGTVNGSGVGAIDLTLAAGASASFGDVAASGASIGAITFSGTDRAGFDFGNFSSRTNIGAITGAVGSAGEVSIGNLDASAGTVGAITLAVGNRASGGIGDIAASGSIGQITVNMGTGAVFVLGSSDVDTGALTAADYLATFAGIAVSGGENSRVTIGAVSAQDAVGNISIAVGSAGNFQISAVESQSAAIGNLTFSVGQGGAGSAESFSGASNIGDITISGSGTVSIASIAASASVGAITVNDGAAVNITMVSATTVGDVTLNGDNNTVTIDANRVGNVSIGGSAVTLTFAGSAGVGDVRVTGGSGTRTLDFGNATGIASISTVGATGSVVIDLDSILRSGVDVQFGAGTNLLRASNNGDVVRLTAGTGADSISFTNNNSDGVVISGFEWSGQDSLRFGTAAGGGFSLGLASAAPGNGSAAALDKLEYYSSGTINIGNTSAQDGATDVLILHTGTYDNINEVFSFLSSERVAGRLTFSAQGGAGSAIAASSDLLLVWYDNDDQVTRLTLVNATASSAGNFFTLLDSGNVVNLAEFTDFNVKNAGNATGTNFLGGLGS